MGSAALATEIEIPYAPRVWADAFHASLARWLVLILHRRAGKTTAILNHHQRAALDDNWERQRLRSLLPDSTPADLQRLMTKRVYWHVMPSYHQAKLTGAWEMAKEFARPIPGVRFNESELLIVYPNGSRLQLIGADKPDSLRGPGLSGLSLDEYSQIPGNAFSEVLSKALADHLGYCIFSGTIKGKDQLYQTHAAAKGDPEWFALWRNIDESLATETGPTILALHRAMADDQRLIEKGLMSQAEYDQEWYLSPEAAIKGAWYAAEMAAAKLQGRITRVPIEPTLPVDTDWDLGIDDNMSIWFNQSLRSGEIRLVDYYEASDEGFPHYIKVLAEKGYAYGKHYPPHDIAVRELGTGKSRKDIAKGLGLKFEAPLPKLEVIDGIETVRALLPKCWFDEERCAKGLECLRQYRKTFNQRLQEFTGTPVHNWASHGADAFRGLAVRYQQPREKRTHMQSAAIPDGYHWT